MISEKVFNLIDRLISISHKLGYSWNGDNNYKTEMFENKERELEDELKSYIVSLEDRTERAESCVEDYKYSFRRTIDDKCPTDERHCGCVPILRVTVKQYEYALKMLSSLDISDEARALVNKALDFTGVENWDTLITKWEEDGEE